MDNTYISTSFTEIMNVVPYIRKVGNEYSIALLSMQDPKIKKRVLKKSLLLFQKARISRYLVEGEEMWVDNLLMHAVLQTRVKGKRYSLLRVKSSEFARRVTLLPKMTATYKTEPLALQKTYRFHRDYLLLLIVLMSSYTILSQGKAALVKMAVKEVKADTKNFRGIDSSEYRTYYEDHYSPSKVQVTYNKQAMPLENNLLGDTLEMPNQMYTALNPEPMVIKNENLDFLLEFLIFVLDVDHLEQMYQQKENILVRFVREQSQKQHVLLQPFGTLGVSIKAVAREKQELEALFKKFQIDSLLHFRLLVNGRMRSEYRENRGEIPKHLLISMAQVTKPEYLAGQLERANDRQLEAFRHFIETERRYARQRLEGEDFESTLASALKKLENRLFV